MDKALEYRFLHDLVAAPTLAELEPCMIDYLCGTFNAQTLTLMEYRANAQPDLLTTHIPNTALHQFFQRHYAQIGYMLDPFYIASQSGPPMMLHTLRQIAPDRFETSEYYARYYSATGLIDELGATLRIGPGRALHLSLGRDRALGRYRAQDARHFHLLAPVVMARLRTLVQSAPQMPKMSSAPDLIQRYRALPGCSGARALTQREAQIAALIVQGHSSRAAGLRLGISDQTIKVHRRNIYKKLHVSSQNELFSLLVRGLVEA